MVILFIIVYYLQFLIITDELNVIGYTSFFQLIFSHLCPDVNFENDELLPVFKIAVKAITDQKNKDK